MVNKRRIGITTRIVNAQGYEEKRDALSQNWVKFLEIENIIPILIPNNLSDTSSYLEEMSIDGIILSGGDNIGDNKDRDNTEKQIIQFGIDNKLPIFGVCRGMQVLNKFFDGKINSNKNNDHVSRDHEVVILKEIIFNLLNQDRMIVNSYHQNIINHDDVGKSLVSFAIHKKDNTVEGFIHKNLPIMGVMWHPERDQNDIILKKFLENKLSVK
jgi:gamma-glutamyl-gamma-aminobutyrate hydrolase PuuD